MKLEAMLTQLGYANNDSLHSQMKRIIDNTRGYDKIAKHIADLNIALQTHNAHIALSNSVDYLKIKCESKFDKELQDVKDKINTWAKKYKVELQKVDGKNTYYILGFK